MKKPNPPTTAKKILYWFLKKELAEEVLGDLYEQFDLKLEESSVFQARLNYWFQVFNYLRPFAIRKLKHDSTTIIYPDMYKNYFLMAFRNIRRQKFYSFINIAGLAAGLVVCLLALLFVSFEFSFDRFNTNGNRIFRVEKQFSRDGRHSLYANPEFGPEIKNLDPHVENYVRLYDRGRRTVETDPRHRFFEDRFLFADTSLFSIFSFHLEEGTGSSLASPSSVIITKSMAKKYFGDGDPLGKVLKYDKDYSFVVSGIATDPPENSSLKFDFIASFNALRQMPQERDMLQNNSSGFPTYLLLSDRSAAESVNRSIQKTNYSNASITYSLAPLFTNHLNFNFGEPGIARYVYVFLWIGVLILLLAIVNFMNLSTARATTRSKEVGIRKVIGARQQSLSAQFYIESAVTCLIAFTLAIGMFSVLKQPFMHLLQIRIPEGFVTSPLFILSVMTLMVVCILLAGSYPALVIPRFKPVSIIKGSIGKGGQKPWLRKSLTVFQFTISTGLIISTMFMNRQIKYMMTRDTGIRRDRVLVIPTDPSSGRSYRVIKDQLQSLPGVGGVTAASIPIYKGNLSGVSLVQSPVNGEKVGAKWIKVDQDFIKVLGISWEQKSDIIPVTGNLIMNETASRAFGFDRSRGISPDQVDLHAGVVNGRIAGITQDFNYQSLRDQIEPLIMTVIPDTASVTSDNGAIYVRLEAGTRLKSKISDIEKIYNSWSGQNPFTYYFLDDAFNEMERGEEQLSDLFGLFTFIALLIAGLGLFALSAFIAERRSREITIRKVLGATSVQILNLLSRNFLLMIILSFIIASPVAWYLMHQWLQEFAFRITLGWDVFLLAGLIVVIVSLFTVSFQSVKAALVNPVEKLRTE